MGLAIGIGFYEGAIISCIFLFGVVTGLHSLDVYTRTHSKIFDIHVELKDISGVTNFMDAVKSDGTKISNIEVKKLNEIDRHIIGLTMTLTLARKIDHAEYILKLHTIENVCSVEEIM
jgi:putative Mg2+ transporter-C (MgtC) family protein